MISTNIPLNTHFYGKTIEKSKSNKKKKHLFSYSLIYFLNGTPVTP